MRARAVIGSNFGDEGKGLFVDYLAATQSADVVIRFNGGAQAGHTVVTPDGKRHVHQHFGSASVYGLPTYLSEFFICNPIMYFQERDTMRENGINPPRVFAHPACKVTTFADMIINQHKEDQRGAARHGSVGLGIHETMQRSQVPELSITMADLWNGIRLDARLEEICNRWAEFRTSTKKTPGKPIEDWEVMADRFIKGCELFANEVQPLGIQACKDPIFEGAQGLLLDQDRTEYHPHVTHSSTGMKNVRVLCDQLGVDQIDTYYISRTYLTRHGAGPLPGEDRSMNYPDETNQPHDYQGALRFAPLDVDALHKRIQEDHNNLTGYKLVMTHCDQREPAGYSDYKVHGPTRNDVEELTGSKKSA